MKFATRKKSVIVLNIKNIPLIIYKKYYIINYKLKKKGKKSVMDYIKQFYKELEDGKNPNDLAKEIQKCLNSAISKREDECKHLEKFEKDAESVAEIFNSFIDSYYPEIDVRYDADMIVQTCELAKSINTEKFDFDNLFKNLFR